MSNELLVGKVIKFNPTESISKGRRAKKIPMGSLTEYQKKINGFEYAEYKSGPKFRNGDTLVAKITPCLENGKTAFVDILEEDEVAFGSSEFIVLRKTEHTDSQFIYYFARSPLFRERAIGCMEGTSGRKRVNENSLKNLAFRFPDLSSQKQIAKVLSDLDSKISLNNRINAELEAMVKLIYDYWFVQFDFPISAAHAASMGKPELAGKPYKSSGGKMVWNKELKREIPEGWEVKELGELLDSNYRNISKADEFEYINYLDTGNLTENRLIKLQMLTGRDKWPSRAQRIVQEGDILYSTVRPNQEHHGIIKSIEPNMVASTGFAQLRSKDSNLKSDLIYTFLKSEWVSIRLQRIADLAVTSYPSISPTDILLLKMPLPKLDSELIKGAGRILDQCYSKVDLCQKQNQKLAELRDWLLPMLMNGQVRVKQWNQN